ncbi:MAG: alpha/beta fold hydrolase [Chloroflexi bacterium]|nr:alpha/beta fold hydrolase [Chloroflexota bacterium]
MPTVRANDIDIYYEECGSGEPLLLIMGWGGNATTWKPQIPGLAEQYRLLVFDNRGVGRTSAPDGPYTIGEMVADTVGLMDALELPWAHVFGISLGGMIAQELALRHPARVGTLILGCTSPGSRRAPGAEQLRSDIAAFREATDGRSPDLEWFSDFLKRLWTEEALAKSDSYLQDFVFSLIRFPPKRHGLRSQADAVSGHDAYRRLHRIRHPTLVITGAEDTLIDPQNSTILAERIPGAELRLFAGLKHAFHLERPDLVNAVIIDFIERARDAAPDAAAAGS